MNIQPKRFLLENKLSQLHYYDKKLEYINDVMCKGRDWFIVTKIDLHIYETT